LLGKETFDFGGHGDMVIGWRQRYSAARFYAR
jgi:hypothetical protein